MGGARLRCSPSRGLPQSLLGRLRELRLPGGSDIKNLPADTGDVGSIPVSGRSPEKGMATHSSTLAWRIPWTEEAGGLQSVGSQRVGHD